MAWIKIILGVWLIVSPWVLAFSDQPKIMWSNIAVGAILVILALVKLFGGKESMEKPESPPSSPPAGGGQ